jgi:uridine phosphorylase
MKIAWYLGHREDEVADRAILIGDPDRIDRIAKLLDDVKFLTVRRGLRTITGIFEEQQVTAVSFGMGAPIATVVLHELTNLGVKHFVRIGTAMYFPPADAGNFLLSESALSFEGTSGPYTIDSKTPVANHDLNKALSEAVSNSGGRFYAGTYATFDAFYRDMFALEPEIIARVSANREMLLSKGVIATDMETSALLTAASTLGVSFTSMCLGTVNGKTQEKLAGKLVQEGEASLFNFALSGITNV